MEKVGLIITALWSVMVAGILCLKWDQVISMPLNEWGDFLAGITAPIAFLWLIIGYMLQRKELNLNTKALQEQQNELSRQVDELSKQNELMQSSIDVLENLTNAVGDQADAITRASYQRPL